MKNTVSASLKALFTVLVWGASFVAIKIVLKYVPPTTLVWMRFALGVVILGAAVGLRRQFVLPKPKDWLYFALLGFLGITFHQWLQSTGLETSQATTTGWIVASMPIFIAILGWLVLKEKLTWLQALGILLAAFGVLLVVTHGNFASLVSGKFGSPGDILILISAPNWAIFTILSRRGLKTYPAALMMFYVMAFGWLFSSVLFVGARGWESIHGIALDGWIALAFLGIFCSGLAYIFWYDALKVLPVAQVGTFLYIEPVVTVVVSFFLLGEKLTLTGIAGGLVILLGVWLVNRASPA
ncbi:MAG TPA: DMT family transporter [Anaerolineales bacterium]|nr:DMT family transporter [Anaerolineales bacterium]